MRDRIVAIDDDAVLMAPYASRLPFQLMLVPRRPLARFEDDGPTGRGAPARRAAAPAPPARRLAAAEPVDPHRAARGRLVLLAHRHPPPAHPPRRARAGDRREPLRRRPRGRRTRASGRLTDKRCIAATAPRADGGECGRTDSSGPVGLGGTRGGPHPRGADRHRADAHGDREPGKGGGFSTPATASGRGGARQRRPRDVRRQGGRPRPARRLRGDRAPGGAPGGAHVLGRPDPRRARRGPLRPARPADRRPRHGRGDPVRAAAADARRRRRADQPVRLPPGRRALRPDGGDRPLGRHARDPHGRASSSRPTSTRTRSSSRSPRRSPSRTSRARSTSPRGSRTSAAASRSTTSAPASAPSTTSSTCRSTTSRSTASSCATRPSTPPTSS